VIDSILLQLLSLFALVVCSALLTGAEAAYFSLGRARLKRMTGQRTETGGSPPLIERPHDLLVTLVVGITVINIRAPRMLGAFGFLRALFEIFERHETVVDVLASGEISISITIEDRSRLSPLLRDLEELGEVWVEERRAIIAVVGIGLRHTPGLAGRVFNAVWPANVEVISQGCSSINMTFVVRQEDGPDVVRRLHREFFGSD